MRCGLHLDLSDHCHVSSLPAHVPNVPLPQTHTLQVHQLCKVDTALCIVLLVGELSGPEHVFYLKRFVLEMLSRQQSD